MTSKVNAPLEVSYIITIIVNGIACPLTLLLNVLVIKAVKTRPRLRTNSNILLACLAVTDVLTGLFASHRISCGGYSYYSVLVVVKQS